VTGLAAVKGLRGDTSIEERARFDNFYIDNWSPWLDLKILFWTIPAVLRGHDG
jgi:lipopolysaccharide/colanic/teichoic acid biosynthesis glycosyltransferase